MTRHGLLRFATVGDGSQCSDECPHRNVSMGDVLCGAFDEPLGQVGSVHSRTRGVSCLAFERAAISVLSYESVDMDCDGVCSDVAAAVERIVSASASDQPVIVLDDLTPNEVRVITGLVRAMRESIVEARNAIRVGDAYESLGLADGALLEARQALNWLPPDEVPAMHAASDAAWHIAHAISQMGES